jgi:chromosome segregation ATPase
MSVTEQSETIITEYKQFNVESFGNDLLSKVDSEIKGLAAKQQANTAENQGKVDGYSKLHDEHKSLQKENTDAHEARKGLFDAMNEENTAYSKFAQEAAQEHAGLRDEITSKEHPLRVLQNEVQNLNLDNKNLQLVIDTEAALREAKAQAELNAVTTVNTDLKDQTQRLENDIKEEREKKGEAKKILDDLNGKQKFLVLKIPWFTFLCILTICF